jgi:hypothetical protein
LFINNVVFCFGEQIVDFFFVVNEIVFVCIVVFDLVERCEFFGFDFFFEEKVFEIGVFDETIFVNIFLFVFVVGVNVNDFDVFFFVVDFDVFGA